LEQHSWFVVQALFAVRHDVFRGTQVPLQFELQHSAELEHAWLSDLHVEPPHVPALQTKVQQSSGVVHEPPALQPPSPPPVPPTVEPPVPVVEPPVPVLEPPVFEPPAARPPAPPELPFVPPAPELSPGALPSLPPQVTSTRLENNITTPAKRNRWIIWHSPHWILST
jgi:hypothetical protein